MTIRCRLAIKFAALILLLPHQLHAAEGGLGTYLLGSKGPMAGVTPDPGWYFQNDLYWYQGGLGRDADLPMNGRLNFGVEGSAILDVPTLIYISPLEVAGGHLGFTASLPIGRKNVDAALSIAGPLGGSFAGGEIDGRNTYGDPNLGALLGWKAGNWHYQIGTQVNVPVGAYDDDRLANFSFNRWSADFQGSVTWLDPAKGLDLSGTVGMTINGENPATQYRTGNELHFEGAAVQHFNKQFDAGLVGYHYEQVTSDGGAGAHAAFRGRVSALGLTAGYNFMAKDRPVSLRVKYFNEFNVRNRAEGDSVYFTLSMPLGSMTR